MCVIEAVLALEIDTLGRTWDVPQRELGQTGVHTVLSSARLVAGTPAAARGATTQLLAH